MSSEQAGAIEGAHGPRLSFDVVGQLVAEDRSIAGLELLTFRAPLSVEDRPGATPSLREFAREARALRPAGESFSETFVDVAARHGELEAALEVIGFHQPHSAAQTVRRVSRDDASACDLRAIAREVPEKEILVLTSRVESAGGRAHIPMLDFKLPSLSENLPAVKSIAKKLGGGFVLDSGSSYHLYGRQLLSPPDFVKWLLHAQLFAGCVDTRWITHQLIEEKAALRLNAGGSRGRVPRVVCVV